jgi:inward rectifier potassium channel
LSGQPEYDDIVVIGAARRPLRDLYHLFLTVRWPTALGAIASAFLLINAVFAAIYLVTGGIEGGMHPGSFGDAFFFSAQTLGTIGYGTLHPTTTAANVVVVFESMVGILFVALATGIVFARFSRSTEAIIFSRVPCIGPMDGVPTLMLRVGNDRENAIMNAQVRIVMVHTHRTAEGVTMYRMKDLVLSRERTDVLTRTFTVMHVVDPSSPLFQMTPESAAKQEVELVVTVVGTDGISLQPVHGRKRYLDKEIRWGARLGDVLTERPDGRLQLDVRRFDDIVETKPTEEFPYPRKEEITGGP